MKRHTTGSRAHTARRLTRAVTMVTLLLTSATALSARSGDGPPFLPVTAARAATSTGVIHTIAGGRVATDTGQPASAAALDNQGGMVVNGSDIYIADSAQNRVEEIPAASGTQWGIAMTAGHIYTIAGSAWGYPDATPADAMPALGDTLNGPVGLSFDGNGNLLIADAGSNRVVMLVKSGNTSSSFHTGTLAANYLYVAVGNAGGSSGRGSNGSGATVGKLTHPSGVAFSNGDIYVADSANNRVLVIPGSNKTAWGVNSGNSITADTMWTIAGQYNGTAGAANGSGPTSSGNGYLNNPADIRLGSAGLLIADENNERITFVCSSSCSGGQYGQTIALDHMATILGQAGQSGTCTSGTLNSNTACKLNDPVSVRVDSNRSVYVSDFGSNRVYELSFNVHAQWTWTGSGQMQANTVYRIAGTGTAGYSGDGGLATSAKVYEPAGATLDLANNLFVADYGNGRAREVSAATSNIATIAGTGGTLLQYGNGGPATDSWLQGPVGTVSGANGDLVISDFGNNRVQAVPATPAGPYGISGSPSNIYTAAGSATGASSPLFGPGSIVAGPDGNLYIANDTDCEVMKLTAAGALSVFAGTGTCYSSGSVTDGQTPTTLNLGSWLGLAADPGSNALYISDEEASRVIAIPGTTSLPLSAASSITVGKAYLIDGSRSGAAGTGASQLTDPTALALDGDGNLFVEDWGDNRVQMVSTGASSPFVAGTPSPRTVYTVAGSGGPGGTSGLGGPATSAQLADLQGLAVDPASSDLYLASANQILEVAASDGPQWGVLMDRASVYDVAGTGASGGSGDQGPAASATLDNPSSIGFDHEGNLLVVDSGNNVIRQVDTSPCGHRYDPTLLDTTAPSTGATGVHISAEPIHSADWPTGLGYKQLDAAAQTDSSGAIESCLPDLGLVQDDPRFESELGGCLTLDVTGAGTMALLTDCLGSYADPILAQHQVTADPAGDLAPAGDTITVEAEPQYGGAWPNGAEYVQVGTGTIGLNGAATASLDFSAILGNAEYLGSNGAVTLDVYYNDGSGQHLSFRAQEYLSDGYDPTLQSETIADPTTGDPIANAAVKVLAEPTDPSTWIGGDAESYPQVGTGTTDGSGSVDVALSPGDYLNTTGDTGFSGQGVLSLDTYYQDANGDWQPAAAGQPDDLSASADPVMGQTEVDDASGDPVTAALVQIHLEPLADSTTCAGPVIGTGATDDSGLVVTTPALSDDMDATYETANEVMIADICYRSEDGSWTFSQRVPYFFGDAKDPVLAGVQLVDQGSGDPVPNTGVLIRAIPTDPSSWPAGAAYPDVGSGTTDGNGYIDATVDLGDEQGDSTFEDGSNTIQLGVYYADSDGNLQLALRVPEHFTPSGDLTAVSGPITNSEGDVVSSQDIVLQAEPLSNPRSESGGPMLATTATDSSGRLNTAVDLGGVTNGDGSYNSIYVSDAGVAEAGVFTTDGEDNLTWAATVPEYVGPSADAATPPTTSDAPCLGEPDINSSPSPDQPGSWLTGVHDPAATADPSVNIGLMQYCIGGDVNRPLPEVDLPSIVDFNIFWPGADPNGACSRGTSGCLNPQLDPAGFYEGALEPTMNSFFDHLNRSTLDNILGQYYSCIPPGFEKTTATKIQAARTFCITHGSTNRVPLNTSMRNGLPNLPVSDQVPTTHAYPSATANVALLASLIKKRAEAEGWPVGTGYQYNIFLGDYFSPTNNRLEVDSCFPNLEQYGHPKICVGPRVAEPSGGYHYIWKIHDSRPGWSSRYNNKSAIFTVIEPGMGSMLGDPVKDGGLGGQCPNEGPPATDPQAPGYRPSALHDCNLDASLVTLSHETFESITDPNFGGNAGWRDWSGSSVNGAVKPEIADYCVASASGGSLFAPQLPGTDGSEVTKANYNWADDPSNPLLNPGGTYLFELQHEYDDLGQSCRG